jgi:hypothetical protein
MAAMAFHIAQTTTNVQYMQFYNIAVEQYMNAEKILYIARTVLLQIKDVYASSQLPSLS